MATIIDSLIVTLGLDANPYKKAAREATREQAKVKDAAKKGGNEIQDALQGVLGTATKLFLGFEGLKGSISYFAGLNAETAALGRFSKNLGDSAHAVNSWDSAVELAGGSAKDAESDLSALSNSITSLKATGDVSSLLLLFQRMNISLYDAQGRTRKLTDLYKELGDRLRTYNRADAFNLAKNAGLSESTFNLIIKEGQERERILQLAEQNNAVTEEAVQKAAEVQQQWRAIGQAIKGAAVTILGDLTPYLIDAFKWMQSFIQEAKKSEALQTVFAAIGGTIRVVADLIRTAWHGLSMLFDVISQSTVGKWLGKLFGKGGFVREFGKALVDEADDLANRTAPPVTPTAQTPQQTEAQRRAARNNPGNIRFAGQASATGADEHGFAKFPTLAAGIKEANRQLDLYASRGINTIEKIVEAWAPAKDRNNVPAYIAALEKAVGVTRDTQLTAANRQRLLQGIFNHEGSNLVPGSAITGALNQGALDTARLASAVGAPGQTVSGGGAGGTTNVQIDGITVVAPAAHNADEVAGELPGALKRKGVVAQADTGMS